MNIYFEKVKEKEYGAFRQDVKDIFSIAVIEEFGESDDEVICDEEINDSLYKQNSEVYYVYIDEKKVGGVALEIDNTTHHNSVDLRYSETIPFVLFFMYQMMLHVLQHHQQSQQILIYLRIRLPKPNELLENTCNIRIWMFRWNLCIRGKKS